MEEETDPSILVVDDEESVQKLLIRVLKRAGYRRIKVASSSEEAREVLAVEKVDLILTDMQMGGDSGLELLTHVHRSMPDIATLMVTGVDDTALADRALTLGAYGYIIKPFRQSEVVINVSNALRRRSLELENRQHRQRLENTVKERTSELVRAIRMVELGERDIRMSRTETIERLAVAAEFRDEETGRHVARMSRYCELLAKVAGVDEHLCAHIQEASSLHDVGKIGISDSILLKPMALTAEERILMQEHAEIGYRILAGSDSPSLTLAATIALSHHERFDGRGYPNGLKGDQIPLPGRIAAVADVFDALTTNRVYRRAYPIGVAVEMMDEESGKQFDPILLKTFWSVLPEVLAIKGEHPSDGISTKKGVAKRLEWEELR